MRRPRVTLSRNGRMSSGWVGPPKARSSTASARIGDSLSRGELVDHLHQRLRVCHRRFGQDAVPEVEDVTGTPARLAEDRLDAPAELRQRREERRRIEVALDGDI